MQTTTYEQDKTAFEELSRTDAVVHSILVASRRDELSTEHMLLRMVIALSKRSEDMEKHIAELEMTRPMVVLGSVRNVQFCGECVHLDVKERDQHDVRAQKHNCLFHKKRVRHEIYHPEIVRVEGCDIPEKEKE